MASKEKPNELWIARIFRLIDATEKNAIWLASGFNKFSGLLSVALNNAKSNTRLIVAQRFDDLQQFIRDRANLEAKKLGIATPGDIQELNRSIEDLRAVLQLWLDCNNSNSSDETKNSHNLEVPEVFQRDTLALES